MLDKQLKTVLNFAQNEMNDLLEQSLTAVDLTTAGEMVLEDRAIGELSVEDALFAILTIAQYVETDTTMESPISDELYDNLHAKYVALTGKRITGTNTSGTNKPLKMHKYPELRGTLSKVHFVYSKDVPKKDTRKSYEDFLNNTGRKASIGLDRINIAYGLKYDGLSAVFECDGKDIVSVLTRKDTENNLGVDITHVFKGVELIDLFDEYIILGSLVHMSNPEYGIKVEIYMTLENFEKFKETVVKPPKNRRSAVSMILNTSADEFNPEWTKYLTVKWLQLSTNEPINVDKVYLNIPRAIECYPIPLGVIDDRYQYMMNLPQHVYDETIPDQLDIMSIELENIQYDAEQNGIPIDGVICTILNEGIINTLGRKDNVNQFQVAYKLPAGIKKTKLLDVEFQVGPVAGTITPVAIIEPVVIMGNTINSPSLSNLAKLKRLDLNVGDEVYIKYDIVPTLFKTDDCVKGTGRHIDPITTCPICGEGLNITDDLNQVRCVNNQCPSKVTGKIYNFINKMGIPNIGLSTVELLVDKGFIKTPADLYRLIERRNELVQVPGLGELSVRHMIDSITSKREVYLHELLGSLGIPDVGRRIMRRISTDGEIQLTDLLLDDRDTINRLASIKGIGEVTAMKIYYGIHNNDGLIRDLLRYIDIKSYEKDDTITETVVFTKVRDPKFAQYLQDTKQANVADSYSKSVTIVIVPDENTTSTKISKAIKDGKVILPINEAYKRFGYNRED